VVALVTGRRLRESHNPRLINDVSERGTRRRTPTDPSSRSGSRRRGVFFEIYLPGGPFLVSPPPSLGPTAPSEARASPAASFFHGPEDGTRPLGINNRERNDAAGGAHYYARDIGESRARARDPSITARGIH
jgi:hypothetical protein